MLPSENSEANYLHYSSQDRHIQMQTCVIIMKERLTRIRDRLQGSPVKNLSDQLDNLTTYQLKIHLWLHRFALVHDGPEEDLEKQAALVSEHLPLDTIPALNSRVSGFESWPIDQLSS